MATDRLPPHDLDAEEAVNGSLLIDGKSIYQVAVTLRPDDFLSEANRWIYQAALTVFHRNEAIDQITIAQELERLGLLGKIGGNAYLNHLLSIVPTSLDIEHYAQIVYRLSIMRQLITAGDKIAGFGYDADPDISNTINKAEDILFRLRNERGRLDFVPIKNILDKYFEEPPPASEDSFQRLPQVYTGFHGLDNLLGGMQRSDLIVLAGRPSMGKTSLALNIARNAAVEQGACVAIFSLEMSKESLVQRLLSSEAEVNSKRMRLGLNSDEEERAIMEAQGKLSPAAIYIDDSPLMKVAEMRSKARRLHFEHPLDLIVLDYLQLLQSEGRNENRVLELSNITRALKGLARELNIPFIAVSQLSRAVEGRAIHTPQLSDLRESGSIEQDADIVVFIYRDEAYYKTEEDWLREHPDQEYPRELADIIVAKHRNGPTGQIKVRFKNALTKFENLGKAPE
ncbi:MAG: replicative DNA helicase [Dehalococcoidia bacterium]|nr:replicative DNA helicase [Dehalococcoidia bacterium]